MNESYLIENNNNNDDLMIKLKKKLKKEKDELCKIILPKKLKSNEKIFTIKNSEDDILSFIWIGIYENEEIGKYINTNFSYTFKNFRSQGYNKLLRLELEKIAKSINIDTLTSKPLEKSYSIKILIDLGYCYDNNYFIKKI